MKEFLSQPFLQEGKVSRSLLALYLAVNLLVALNALLHYPEIGYDANDHLLYMQTLPQRLPSDDDTREFFSPPLPYFIPSLVNEACELLPNAAAGDFDDCRYVGGKSGQILNILLSLGSTWLLLQIADLWRPGRTRFKLAVLAFLGILPVYYKTFSQFRGEPYVLFFALLSLFLFLRALDRREYNLRSAGWLGLSMGLLILSRQWGIFVIFSILAIGAMLLLFFVQDRRRLALLLVVSLAVAFVVGSWFYFHLYLEYGSFTAFARNTEGFSFANKPSTFYRNTGFQNFLLFRRPTYGSFNNMFIPTFYSEVWGDYWGFYTQPNLTEDVLAIWDWTGVDYKNASRYLGRVNAVSLPLALFLVAGVVYGAYGSLRWLAARRKEFELPHIAQTLITTLVIFSLSGYLWFVITYPAETGDTIKATYQIQVFGVLPLLAAHLLETLAERNRRVFQVAMALLLLMLLHNLPAMITRYIYF